LPCRYALQRARQDRVGPALGLQARNALEFLDQRRVRGMRRLRW
jgi:hypothetical protein